MDKLNVAVIGCGAISPLHAEAIHSYKHADLVVMVDNDEQRAKQSAEQNGCCYARDYRQILLDANIDVVHICTPHHLHFPMACDTLSHGKHVLIEKPMALNANEAQEIWILAQQMNKHCCVAFQNRFSPQIIKAKEIIDGDILGKVLGARGIVTWFREAQYYTQGSWRGKWATEGGGALINQTIHTLDLLLFLVGTVSWVDGSMGNYFLADVIEVEDTFHAALGFANGARGLLFGSTGYSRNSPFQIEIHGEKALLNIIGTTLTVFDNHTDKKLVEYDNPAETEHKQYWGTGHSGLIHAFYDAIIKGEPGYPTGADALHTQRVVDAIYNSSITGKRVMI